LCLGRTVSGTPCPSPFYPDVPSALLEGTCNPRFRTCIDSVPSVAFEGPAAGTSLPLPLLFLPPFSFFFFVSRRPPLFFGFGRTLETPRGFCWPFFCIFVPFFSRCTGCLVTRLTRLPFFVSLSFPSPVQSSVRLIFQQAIGSRCDSVLLFLCLPPLSFPWVNSPICKFFLRLQ